MNREKSIVWCCASQRLTHGSPLDIKLYGNSSGNKRPTSACTVACCCSVPWCLGLQGVLRGSGAERFAGGGSRGAAERIHRGSNQMRVVGTGRVGFGTSVRGQLESKQGCNNKAAQNAGKPDAGWLRAPG